MSDLPSYPEEAAEREAAQGPPTPDRHLSSWGRRLVAYLIDLLIILVPVGIVIGIAVASLDPDDEDNGAGAAVLLAYLASIVVPFIYFTIFHGRPSGQTLGKRALGIRVAGDETGTSIGYGRAFGRYAIIAVFGFFFIPIVLDYLWPLWDRKNQALHDKVVGSVVERV